MRTGIRMLFLQHAELFTKAPGTDVPDACFCGSSLAPAVWAGAEALRTGKVDDHHGAAGHARAGACGVAVEDGAVGAAAQVDVDLGGAGEVARAGVAARIAAGIAASGAASGAASIISGISTGIVTSIIAICVMGLTVIFFRIIVFRMFFMSRTTLIWKAICCKVFCYTWTTGICQISANCADGFLLYRTWHYKIFCFKILMYSAHDSFPDAETEFSVRITFFVIIITAPYSTCVIWCISDKP